MQNIYEQLLEFERVLLDCEALGVTPNGFFTQMYNTCLSRIEAGEPTPLNELQMRVITYQDQDNMRRALR
jgi:hypothetical protein